MKVADVFYNQNKQLRSGWQYLLTLLRSGGRALLFVLLFLFFGVAFGFAADLLFKSLVVDFSESSILYRIFNSSAGFAAAALAAWLCVKYLENLPFRALGIWLTKGWFKDLILGLIFGAAALMLAVLIAYLGGGLSFQSNQTNGSSAILLTLSISLVVFVVGAAFEEMLFRGYVLQTFARAKMAWFAILLTSLFFGAGHFDNSNADYLSTVNTILAGIWFSLAFLKTRTLWLPFGLHLAWNWFQGAIFGIEVSGITSLTTAPLLQEIDRGPAWLTGENYGIEGGVAATVSLIIFIVLTQFLPIFKPTEEMLALTDDEKPRPNFS